VTVHAAELAEPGQDPKGERLPYGPPLLDEAFWLVCAVIVAAVLRLFRLGQNSLWIDELASLQVALLPLGQIPAAALHGSAFEPPVYFWLLHGTVDLLGTSDWALRAPSALAGILTVPVAWLLVRELTARAGAATVVAFLVATNPLHVWYSQEARPYALALLLGLASLLALRRALRGGRSAAWTGYAVLGALAILCHLTSIVIPAVGGLWVVLDARRRKTVVPFLAASAVLLLLIAPFLLAVVQSIQPGSTGSPPRPLTGLEVPYTLFTYVAGYSFGPSVRDIQDFGWQAAVRTRPLQSAITGVVLMALLALGLRSRRQGALALGALLIVPLAVAFLGSAVTTKAYNVRYTLPALIGLLGIAGVAVAGSKSGARRALVGALLVVFLWADAQWYFVPGYWKEDSRAAVAWLRDRLPAGATVAVGPGYMRGVLARYGRAAGTELCFVGISLPEDLPSRPAALLLTRRHHVAAPAALEQAFRDRADAPLLAGAVPGYQILADSSAGSALAGQPACRSAE
jgi:uncharacterized membrane protein